MLKRKSFIIAATGFGLRQFSATLLAQNWSTTPQFSGKILSSS